MNWRNRLGEILKTMYTECTTLHISQFRMVDINAQNTKMFYAVLYPHVKLFSFLFLYIFTEYDIESSHIQLH